MSTSQDSSDVRLQIAAYLVGALGHQPPANPGLQVHLNLSTLTDLSVEESLQVAPFWHRVFVIDCSCTALSLNFEHSLTSLHFEPVLGGAYVQTLAAKQAVSPVVFVHSFEFVTN
jgi:hypothetical protein